MADELRTQIRAMPKIELHRHLEGSLRLETLLSIAVEYDITLPSFSVEGLRPHVQVTPHEERSWERFLSKFGVLRQFYRSDSVIQRVTQEVIADAAADNIKYMELRFTPQALNNIVNETFTKVVEWVCDATREAAAQHDIHVNLILSMNRHESLAIGEAVLEAALEFANNGVVGVDLAGREADYPARPFQSLFERAKAAGLGVTIHAGEWSGAESVRDAVEFLHCDRIGHGIRAIEDEALVERLVEMGTVLEVCPTSNVDSGVIADLSVHPLADLYRSGVKTTINTDDPLVSDITLSDEIERIIVKTNLTLEDVKQQMLTAARAAFLPHDQREALVEQFQHWLYEMT
ncbi:MAG TPA: adenosine deaminase [Oceanobacillus sp.]|nr:adenosine deaminase [Oceanobacillus sp.]